MPTGPNDTDLTDRAERRRLMGTIAVGITVPVTAMLVASASLWAGVAVLVVGVLGAAVYGQVRGRVTREGTDERARDLHRRAGAFSWQLTAAAILGAWAWTFAEDGPDAARPFLYLLELTVGGYVGALLWRRWRGL